MEVIKRDGRLEAFEADKILVAVSMAWDSVEDSDEDKTPIYTVVNEVVKYIDGLNQDTINIETIQDLVEVELMKVKPDVAKAYILYRDKRNKAREYSSDLIKTIMTKTDAKDVVNANANIDENSFSGRKQEASSYIQKKLALDYLMPPEIAQAHKDGWLYEHDLDCYNIGSHNCLNINFNNLFKNGFQTRNGDVRRPSTFATACQQLAVIMQCQSQVQFGGVGMTTACHDLAPFVKLSFIRHFKIGLKYVERFVVGKIKDSEIYIDNKRLELNHQKAYTYAMDMLEKEGNQASEALWHNLNTLESRQGSQVPFSSLNYGRNTTTEGRLITKWFLNASLRGIGNNHKTSIFPISIFSYKQGVNANPDDPNYDLKQLALESMSKRIYPNWCNGDWSEAHEDPDDPETYMSTMGKCKLQPM